MDPAMEHGKVKELTSSEFGGTWIGSILCRDVFNDFNGQQLLIQSVPFSQPVTVTRVFSDWRFRRDMRKTHRPVGSRTEKRFRKQLTHSLTHCIPVLDFCLSLSVHLTSSHRRPDNHQTSWGLLRGAGQSPSFKTRCQDLLRPWTSSTKKTAQTKSVGSICLWAAAGSVHLLQFNVFLLVLSLLSSRWYPFGHMPLNMGPVCLRYVLQVQEVWPLHCLHIHFQR